MNSDLNNRDFERFLQQNADQYRMFPSEKVWEGVHAALHKRRRRYGFGLTLLFLTAVIITGILLTNGDREPQEKQITRNDATEPSASSNPGNTAPAGNLASTSAVHPVTESGNFISSSYDKMQDIIASDNSVSSSTNNDNVLTANTDDLTRSNATTTATRVQADPVTDPVLNNAGTSSLVPVTDNTVMGVNTAANLLPAYQPTALTDALLPHNAGTPDAKRIALSDMAKADESDLKTTAEKDIVANKSARRKLSWALYLTPTLSYRHLTENLEYLSAARYNNIVNGGAAVAYPSDINSMVNHRPDMGFQLGLRGTYPVSRWFSITGGLQLGVSKYDIRATEHPAEAATIALRDRNVSTVSTYRNAGSYKQSWLQSYSFTAAVPVGLELKLSDGEKNYFGIAGTVQPSYVIDNRSYVLSADLKNYAEVPSLTRKWNMNTSFEIFTAHTTGKLKWRIGPEVQYQALSSFKKNYPIKEHIVNFGLKLGIQLK